MLRDSANRWPDACAIKHGDKELSFSQLLSGAVAVARWLVSNGLRPGNHVALLSDASCDYVVAYYGVLMSGCAVVAVNASTRAEEVVGLIEHSEAAALLVDVGHPEAAEVLRRLNGKVSVLALGGGLAGIDEIDFESVVLDESDSFVLPDIHAAMLAAIIYTSGTTGRPKSVMLDHGNLAANTSAIIEYLRLSETDSIACVLPFYYSYGNSVLHTHIAAGARLIIEPSLVFPHRVVEMMARERVTGFAGVPSTFALLSARVNFADYDLSGLRYLTQAGGPMSPALTKRIQSLLPSALLFVMYGQTEATARVTYLPPERLDDKLGSVGLPIPGVAIEVRNENGDLARPGVAGDLWVKGRNVMTGYWKDPEATKLTLVDGWLKTGDAARLDEDGFCYIEGRRSDIIKTGAHRVYPRDIEVVIEELPGVSEVAVVGADDEILGQVVKACIVRDSNTLLSDLAIKAHCRAHLAGHKIPKIVEFVNALPKTASGKVLRHQL